MNHQQITKWIRRNPVNTALLGGIGLSLVFSSGNLMQNASTLASVRTIAQQNAQKQMELQASEQARLEQAKIADARYQAGCIIVVSSADPKSFTALTEGQPVIDSARKVPLSPGATVCDSLGGTGRIVQNASGKPVVGEMAFTGNAELIRKAMARANARYRVPQV